MQELGDDQVGDLVVHRRAEEDDPLVQEAAVDVERALPAGGLFDDHRYEWAHGPRFVSLRELESFSRAGGPSDGPWPLTRRKRSNAPPGSGPVLSARAGTLTRRASRAGRSRRRTPRSRAS